MFLCSLSWAEKATKYNNINFGFRPDHAFLFQEQD